MDGGMFYLYSRVDMECKPAVALGISGAYIGDFFIMLMKMLQCMM